MGARTPYVYVANFLGSTKDRILRFAFDTSRVTLEPVDGVSDVERPIYLETGASGWLFAADCRSRWREGGALAAFRIADDGALRYVNARSCHGVIPVFIHVSRDRRWVLAASCGPFEPGSHGRTVCALPLSNDGLGEASSVIDHHGSSIDEVRQTGPHPHSIALDPTQRFALVPDLGADEILIYGFDSGALSPHGRAAAPRGCGPRHLRFHPGGVFVYVSTEISGEVLVYGWDTRQGALTLLQRVSTVPHGTVERNGAELHVHPSGRVLYSSNRDHESITAFAIADGGARLVVLGHAATGGGLPRSFDIHPDGRWLVAANELSGTLKVFRIDPDDARLMAVGDPTLCPGPACVRFA